MNSAPRLFPLCLALVLALNLFQISPLGAQAPAGSTDGIGATIGSRDLLLHHPLLEHVLPD